MKQDEDFTPPEKLVIEKLAKEAQIDIAELLQAGLLNTYLRRLQAGTISDTGLAALQRLLSANGWSLDPANVPKELRNMLTSQVSAEELDDDVIPIRKPA